MSTVAVTDFLLGRVKEFYGTCVRKWFSETTGSTTSTSARLIDLTEEEPPGRASRLGGEPLEGAGGLHLPSVVSVQPGGEASLRPDGTPQSSQAAP